MDENLRMNYPAISVLMPVYNNEMYIQKTIESILNQTFTDFEYVIVDDGSSDNSAHIISLFDDPRIVRIKNVVNEGLIGALNKGFKMCRGRYIARIDADDICEPTRLAEQFSLMEKDNSIGVSGSDFRIINNDTEGGVVHCLTDSELIKCAMLFYCPMAHPSVIMRSEILRRYSLPYDPEFISAEDYELWWRLSAITKFTNINKPLLKYRLHSLQISEADKSSQTKSADRLRERMLSELSISFTPNELIIHNQFGRNSSFDSIGIMHVTEKWLIHLLKENKIKKFFPESKFCHIVSSRWLSFVSKSALGVRASVIFLFSKLTWSKSNSFIEIIKTTIKCARIR